MLNLLLYFKLFWARLKLLVLPIYGEYYYSKIGHIYFELGNDLLAIDYLNKSLEINKDADITLTKFNWFYLGYSYINVGEFQSSLSNFLNYLRFDNNNFEILLNIAKCYFLINNYENSMLYYDKVIELEPNLVEAYFEKSGVLFKIGKKKEAVDILKKIDNNLLHEIEKQVFESIVARYQGDLEKSLKLFKNVEEKINNDPSILDEIFNYNIHSIYASISLESGDKKGAIKVLENAIKIFPDDDTLYNELAFEYAEQNVKLEEAKKLIEHVIHKQPNNPYFLDTKGWVLYKMNKTGEAKSYIELALKLNPNCDEIKLHYNKLITNQ